MKRFATFAALAWLCAVPAAGKTLNSANNGIDGPSCGSSSAPCRSISAALANASDGDTIVVGPGFYGDLDDNGDWNDPGDEFASPASGCFCVIAIRKRVTVKSRDGADATVIEAGSVANGVWLGAGSAGAIFSGFTVNGGANGIVADTGADAVVLTNDVVRGGTSAGIGVFNGGSAKLQGVHAIGRAGYGFNLDGVTTLKDCIAQSNANYGIYASKPVVVQKSVAVANGDFGFSSVLSSGEFKSISSLANLGGGVMFNVSTGSLESSTIMGNSRVVQCGVASYGGADFAATGNFFGGPEGPGVAPSDPLCESSAPLAAVPFKKTEIKVVPKAIR